MSGGSNQRPFNCKVSTLTTAPLSLLLSLCWYFPELVCLFFCRFRLSLPTPYVFAYLAILCTWEWYTIILSYGLAFIAYDMFQSMSFCDVIVLSHCAAFIMSDSWFIFQSVLFYGFMVLSFGVAFIVSYLYIFRVCCFAGSWYSHIV